MRAFLLAGLLLVFGLAPAVAGNPTCISGTLASHGVKAEQVPRLVEVASADICHQTNPRSCTAADFEALFKAAL